jgi:hypothetical protein
MEGDDFFWGIVMKLRRIPFFRFLPSPHSPPGIVKLHAIIEVAADYALIGCMIGVVVLGAYRFIRPLLTIGLCSYLVLGFFLSRATAALVLLGRDMKPPASVLLLTGRGKPLSIAGRFMVAIPAMIGATLGVFGLIAVLALAVVGSYGVLGLALLLTAGPIALAIGCFMKLSRRGTKPLPSRLRPPPSPASRPSDEGPDPFKQVQGRLTDAILVEETASSEPRSLVQANVDFVNWALEDALLIPGEFPREALYSYHVDFYLAQINNGGHAQFAFNSQMQEGTIDNVGIGLKEMGAVGADALFQKFLAVMRSRSDLVASVQQRHGFSGPASRLGYDELCAVPELKALNEQFFKSALGTQLLEQNAAWLRGLPSLRHLSGEALRAERQAIKGTNLLLSARQAKLARLRQGTETEDITHVVAKRLCAAVGLSFQNFTAGQALRPDVMWWGMMTSGGPRTLVICADHADIRDTKMDVLTSVRLPLS